MHCTVSRAFTNLTSPFGAPLEPRTLGVDPHLDAAASGGG